MIKNEYKHSGITSQIIGCSMEVHKSLGNGFKEVFYQKALAKELKLRGLSFAREIGVQISYKEEDIGMRRMDFIIEQVVLVEIKALKKLGGVHFKQVNNYLELYNLEIGLLINFGAKSLEFRRLVNPKFKTKNAKLKTSKYGVICIHL